MAEVGLNSNPEQRRNQLRQVQAIRFSLPLLMFLIALGYEVGGHWLAGKPIFNPDLASEVLYCGVLLPAVMFIALSYIASLLKDDLEIANQLETLNENLEAQVAERTRALAARNVELAEANAELKQLDRLKSDFVSLVSHELRAPLTTLGGGFELVLQDTNGLPPQSRRTLEIMARENERLTQLVKRILDTSYLEAGRLALNPGPVAVAPLLKRTVSVMVPQRQIIWQIEAGLPPVWADETYLEQVISNLLSNADGYSPAEAPLEVCAELSWGDISISITDYGPGIPLESQRRIFERFYRLEEGEAPEQRGWGLGLYLASALARAQGGDLIVKSPVRDGRTEPGAAFIVTLPVAAETDEDDRTVAD